MRYCFLIITLFISFNFISAQKTEINDLPVVEGKENLLFYIQRTSGVNTVIYDAVTDASGNLAKNPIDIYWLRFSNDSLRRELTYIQKKFAYGVKTKKVSDNEYNFTIQAYSDLKINLKKKQRTNKYAAYVNLSNEIVQLKRVVIVMEDGESMWIPKIEKVIVEAIEPNFGYEVSETFYP